MRFPGFCTPCGKEMIFLKEMIFMIFLLGGTELYFDRVSSFVTLRVPLFPNPQIEFLRR